MINTKVLLTLTFVIVATTYYVVFPINQIVNIILDEYITIGVASASLVVYIYFKIKLKDRQIYELIPNTNYVPIKSTILFFLLFEAVDFYTEDGLIGMIKLWFTYWVFGLIVYFITHIINFYKNYKLFLH